MATIVEQGSDYVAELQADRLRPEVTQKVARAFERRFGQSVLPLRFRLFQHKHGALVARAFDQETGSWADYNVSWPRIQRIAEHDAIAKGLA